MKKGEIAEGIVSYVSFPDKGIILLEDDDRKVVLKGGIAGQRINLSVCILASVSKTAVGLIPLRTAFLRHLLIAPFLLSQAQVVGGLRLADDWFMRRMSDSIVVRTSGVPST